MSELKPLLTVKDVCNLLKIGRTKVHELAKSGDLRPVYIGKRNIRFTESDIRRFTGEMEAPDA